MLAVTSAAFFTESDIRRAAVVICRYHSRDCVMDEDPPRPLCTLENCEVMRVAQSALCKAAAT